MCCNFHVRVAATSSPAKQGQYTGWALKIETQGFRKRYGILMGANRIEYDL